jgi:hypothetical protein
VTWGQGSVGSLSVICEFLGTFMTRFGSTYASSVPMLGIGTYHLRVRLSDRAEWKELVAIAQKNTLPRPWRGLPEPVGLQQLTVFSMRRA